MPKRSSITKLPPKLETILLLIYRFRFLNRPQIQRLLNHKHHPRVNIWLNILSSEKYVRRYYSFRFAGNAAYYSLGTRGRAYFKAQTSQNVKEALLDRVWSEHKTSDPFKKKYMLLGDVYLSLTRLANDAHATLNFYTEVDLKGMNHLIRPEPSGYFSLTDANGLVKRYFLEIFEYANQKDHNTRIGEYYSYFECGYWQDNTGNPFPEVILICPNKASMTFCKKSIRRQITEYDVNIRFYLITWNEVKATGLVGDILHKVEMKE